ncbi:MAG: hypothetical protein ACMG57_04175 [Candidatus Dojkabacteria bacterium]
MSNDISTIQDKLPNQTTISTTLPEDFFPEFQEKYNNTAILTREGSDLLERNPFFFQNLQILIERMEEKIEASIIVQKVTGRMFLTTLEDSMPIALANNLGKQFTLSFLDRGSESWAFLITIDGEPEKYVLKMPTRGLIYEMSGPLEELKSNTRKKPPQYKRQLKVTLAMEDTFEEELNKANMHLPEYIMACDFFSITRFEKAGEPVDDEVFKSRLEPTRKLIKRKIQDLAILDRLDFWDGVVVDWMTEDSFRVRDDGSYVCIDPITIY